MPFINHRRIRDYPRLMLVSMWGMLILNLLLHDGWIGGTGQVIGTDFVSQYGAGLLYRQDIDNLYDPFAQQAVEQDLIKPSVQGGANFFTYPPHAALAYSPYTYLPLHWGLALRTVLTILITLLASFLLYKYLLPARLSERGFTPVQLSMLIFSFFPFVEGLQVGQNHGLTLLLMTGMVIFTLKEKWILAGSLAGLLIYKPQFVLGFLIIWLVWRKFRALAAFAAVGAAWCLVVIAMYGLAPYEAYLDIVPVLMQFPYDPGYPGFLVITLYGFLTSVLPWSTLGWIVVITQLMTVIMGAGLAWYAFTLRRATTSQRIPALMLAMLYPLLVSPHVLLHDIVVLAPFFILWSHISTSRRVLYAAIAVYFGALFLPLLAHTIEVSISAAIPLALFIAVIQHIYRDIRGQVKPEEIPSLVVD